LNSNYELNYNCLKGALMAQVLVHAEPTPNPNAVKFALNCPVVQSGSKTYANPIQAEDSPLAKAIFAVGSVANVVMTANSITVFKKVDAAWGNIIPKVEKAILENIRHSSTTATA
jgi:hypothetical protein